MKGNFNFKATALAMLGCVTLALVVFGVADLLGGVLIKEADTQPTVSSEMTYEELTEWTAKMKAANGEGAQSVAQEASRQVREYLVAAGLLHVDDNGATGTGYGPIDMLTPVPVPKKNPSQTPSGVGINDTNSWTPYPAAAQRSS